MNIWTCATIPVLAALTACTPISVRYDYDSGVDLAAWKTYDWYAASPKAKGRPDGVQDSLMDRRVRRIVERELAARGFAQRPEGEPDFRVVWYPVYQEHYINTYTALGPAWGWGYGWGGRPWGYGVATGFQEVRRFQEGSLVLEVVDGKRDRLVWQAVAEGALTGIRNPQDAEEQVTRAVRRMLQKFPPPAAKG